MSRSAKTIPTTAASSFVRPCLSWSQATGRLRETGFHLRLAPSTSMTTSARALESPATFALSSGDRRMRTSTTRASMSATGSLLKTTLRLTTRSLRTTSPDSRLPGWGSRTLAFWPTLHLADVLLVDLGDGVHDVGVADLEDALVARRVRRARRECAGPGP